MIKLEFVEKILHVTQLDRSVRFYCDLLGFVEVDRDEFMGQRMAHVSRPELRLFLLQEAFEIPPPEPFRLRMQLHFKCSGSLDETYQGFIEYGARIVQEPGSTPWGDEAFMFADPDGYRLLMTGPGK